MGPTAFPAITWDIFIPEDVVGRGTVSRRYPRISLAPFLCQKFAQFFCPEHLVYYQKWV